MPVYILDSSAVLRYIDDEAGADRVEEIINACTACQAEVLISAVQWGEIAGKLRVRLGEQHQMNILGNVLPSETTVVPADRDSAVRAATLKVDRKIAYADGFALELAMRAPNRVLVTADYGFKAVADLARIEFLPVK